MSNKSNIDMLIDGYADLIRIILDKNPLFSEQETQNELFNLCPAFQHDKTFLDFFPHIYQIHIKKAKLAEQGKN